MNDLPEKAPIKHEQIVQRSDTVDGLLDDTIGGVRSGGRLWSVSEFARSGADWSRVFANAQKSLKLEGVSGAAIEEKARNAVLLDQLARLNSFSEGQRKEMLGALLNTEKQYDLIEKNSEALRGALRTGNLDIAIEVQQRLVSDLDLINPKALVFEFESIENRRKQEHEPALLEFLDLSLENARCSLAAPFIERARLASILLAGGRVYQAEKILEQAMKTTIPSESMESPYLKELRRNTALSLRSLKVENNLLELYDQNLSRLDIDSKDGLVSKEELSKAASKDNDENLKSLADFLDSKYQYLTRKHWSFLGHDGISRSDIVNYVNERAKKINDLKL